MKEKDFPQLIKGPSNGGQNILKNISKNVQKEYNLHKDQWNSNIAIFKTD